MKKFDIINADILENISLSKSRAVYEDKKIIVSGGYEGQNADLKITKIKNSRAEAVIEKVLKKAPFQTEAKCASFGKCGGCSFQDITYEKQLALKEEYIRRLFEKASLPFEKFEHIIPSPVEYGYKNKMEFSFGNEVLDGELTIGMHEKGRHYSICRTPKCEISPDDFSVVLNAVQKFFRDNKTPFFSQKTKSGSLRHLVLRHSLRDNEILLNLVTSSEAPNLDGFCDMLLSLKLDGRISGILHSVNGAVSDIVKSDSTTLLYGRDFITEQVCKLDFKITPFSFFQTNTRACELLYKKALEYAGDCSGKNVFDLYCGTGTIAQAASKGAKTAYGIEIVEEAVTAARENAERNGIKNCEFICGDVLDTVESLSVRPDIIILDPPRSGIHPKALPKILDFAPDTFVYISCKATSLISELPSFLEKDYEIKSVCPVDMFPHTEHVETVVLLQRETL